MSWRDELPEHQSEQVRRIMLWREGCCKRYMQGLMDKETAQIGVRLCNEMIAEIWRNARIAEGAV